MEQEKKKRQIKFNIYTTRTKKGTGLMFKGFTIDLFKIKPIYRKTEESARKALLKKINKFFAPPTEEQLNEIRKTVKNCYGGLCSDTKVIIKNIPITISEIAA